MSVLVGPNGSGKTNLLKVLDFVANAARFDIDGAISMWGGYEHVHRQAPDAGPVVLIIEGQVTTYASEGAPDSYRIKLNQGANDGRLRRTEELNFKRVQGPGRKITVSETVVKVDDDRRERLASGQTSGLGTLARLSADVYGPGPAAYVRFLSSIRYLDPRVELARQAHRISRDGSSLNDDSSNLADALYTLDQRHPERFSALLDDAQRCLPGLKSIIFQPVQGSAPQVSVHLVESGLSEPVALADVSFGTVRLLALLCALHDPKPAALTVIEEIDHGLHPYALDVLVDRMRAATTRTQILAASHSPTLVNRLSASEIIICDRDPETSESIIPARDAHEIEQALAGSEFGAGELWFAGALGGVPR